MFRIAICGEKTVGGTVKDYIERYLLSKEISCVIDTFCFGRELLELGVGITSYSAVFLDIDADTMEKIAAGRWIRECSPQVHIVFVSDCIYYSLEGYKVGAVRYLLKNNRDFVDSICECMDAILERMKYTVVNKMFQFNECRKSVPLERILYIESRLHKLEFHIMENGLAIYTLYGTLNGLEKDMQEFRFLRIHQSFLVNLKHVKSVAGYRVVLSNDEELMIPKTRYKNVKNSFMAYKEELQQPVGQLC